MPNYQPQLDQIASGAQIAPVVQGYDESNGVAGRVDRITRSSSPLMQTAATRASQQANQRGLRNSSLAVQAGQQAVIEAAAPIATADASMFQTQSLTNQNARNRTNEFNANNRVNLGVEGIRLGEAGRQFDTTTGENRREFDVTSGLRGRELSQQESQFGRSLMEQARQYNSGVGLRREELGQQASQFTQNLALQQRQLDAQRDQFAQSLGLDREQLGLQRDQLTTQQQQFLRDLDLRQAQLTEQARQANQTADTQRTIAQLDATSRRELATIESSYRSTIAANENVSNAWGTMMQHVAQIQNNPDLEPAARETLIQNTLNGFRSYVDFWSNTAPGVDVSGLLDFGAGGSFSPSGSQAPPTGSTGSTGGAGAGGAAAPGDSGPDSPGSTTGGYQPGFGPDGMTAVTPSTGLTNSQASMIGTGLGAVAGLPGLGTIASWGNEAINDQHTITAASFASQMDSNPSANGTIGGDGVTGAGYGGDAAAASAAGVGQGDTVGGFDGSSEGSGGGDGGKVICAELYRQGRLEPRLYELDEAFGDALALDDPLALDGYQRWALPVVALMKHSRTLSAVVAAVARPWIVEMAREMGHGDGSRIGRLMMRVGLPLCRVLGRSAHIPSAARS